MKKTLGKSATFAPEINTLPETVALKTKKPIKRGLEDSMYLEQDEKDRLFRVIASRRDKAIFRLVYHRGLRAHEVGLIQLSDWRDRDTLLFIHRGKGSVSRAHRLVDEEAKALRAYIRLDRGSRPGPMFPSRQGTKGISRFRLDGLMKLYCAEAGIRPEKAHMHALKHSCGTHLAEMGNTADIIQDWLGHRDAGSTAIYMHFTRLRREAAVEKNRDWA